MNKGGNLRIKKSSNKTQISIIIFSILTVSAIIFCVWFNFFKNTDRTNVPVQIKSEVDETEVTQEDKDEHTVPANNPRFISIPALGVDRARVVSIGLISGSKQLDSPISIFDAGWYTKSAKPGTNDGALLLDGHNGGPSKGGIFDKLGDLTEGSEIIVERGDGQKFTYKVVSNKQLTLVEANDKSNPDGMSTMLESAESGKQGLNIITCVGNWVAEQNTFDQRVMLRAVQSE
ncbi:class F sortase [Candidatus Saccharibacteria bacterium]|jgi:sortase (surface protein transpeptidase)|nr:class F sortase [Candidatus Saccharibacteria bacterium]MBP9551931.1 class F sortase [Candidatus Saccharibacteria bacterium]